MHHYFLIFFSILGLGLACPPTPKPPEPSRISINFVPVPTSECEKKGGHCFNLPAECTSFKDCGWLFKESSKNEYTTRSNKTKTPRRLSFARSRWVSINRIHDESDFGKIYERVVGTRLTRKLVRSYRSYRLTGCWEPNSLDELCNNEKLFCCMKVPKPSEKQIINLILQEKERSRKATPQPKPTEESRPAQASMVINVGGGLFNPNVINQVTANTDLDEINQYLNRSFADSGLGLASSFDKFDPDQRCARRFGICLPSTFKNVNDNGKCTSTSKREAGFCYDLDYYCCLGSGTAVTIPAQNG